MAFNSKILIQGKIQNVDPSSIVTKKRKNSRNYEAHLTVQICR